MAAFRAALDLGAGIECDLRLSRDGFPMVFHDPGLQRLCGIDAQTEYLDAAALMELALGATGERIPRLGDLLALVGGKVPLLLELKTAPGRPAPPVNRLCRAVADSLQRYGGAVGVMSFDPRVGQWFARNAPAVARGLVLHGSEPAWRRGAMLVFAMPQFLAVSWESAEQPWVARQRRRGLPVGCWTITDQSTLARLANHMDAPIWEGDGRPRS
jgi:glycerophosphoryl diester phosphodiesterase